MDEATSGPRPAGEMTLFEHLRELRSRLGRAVIALAIGTVVGYIVFPYVIDVMISPYCDFLATRRPGADCTLIALRPLEPFSVRIKTALMIGLFVGGPVIFYQLWRFITPALTVKERRYALPFVVMSQVMFTIGILAAWFVIPQALRVLLVLGGPSIQDMLVATEYMSFFLAMCLAFGLVFELPLVLIYLSLLGMVRAATLRRIRPYAVVIMVIAAAIITPTTDAVTLLLIAGPMLLFYELSIVAAYVIERSRRRAAKT